MLRAAPDVVTETLEDETVLLKFGTGTYYGLDAMGTRFWDLLSREGDRERVLAALLVEFEVDRARLERDLDELVAALLAKGLLTDAP